MLTFPDIPILRAEVRECSIDLVRNFNQPTSLAPSKNFGAGTYRSVVVSRLFLFPAGVFGKTNQVYWLYFCIVATFVVIGFWHGAAWSYICMGLFFGALSL